MTIGLTVVALSAAGLAWMQYATLRAAETQAELALQAGLDSQLIALVAEARRDVLERASQITHSLSHPAVRERDLPRLARSCARGRRRADGIDGCLAVLFERGQEDGPWRVVRHVSAQPIDRMHDDPTAARALRRAWRALPERRSDRTYAVFAPAFTPADAPRQIFFHPVYEPSHMEQSGETQRVGLLVLVTDSEHFPAADYFRGLVQRGERQTPGLGRIAYRVSLEQEGGARRELALTGTPPDAFRERRFAAADGLDPRLAFGAALAERANADYVRAGRRHSLALSLGVATLALIAIGVTWRAGRREMRLAYARAAFLAGVSHELKTPLTAIRAFGDLLRSRRVRDPERVQKYGELIALESQRLTGMLDNVLAVARADGGARRYRLEPQDLRCVARDTVELFRPLAAVQGAHIELRFPEAPVAVRIDPAAVHQALMNLLSNAVKYSGGGARRIEVDLTVEREAALLSVRDHGLGIPPEELRRIFEPYFRGASPDVTASPGTGLGLAVVRDVARGHGGEVQVDSRPHTGSVFTVRLPLAPGEGGLGAGEGAEGAWRTSS